MDVATVIRYVDGLRGHPLNPDEAMHHPDEAMHHGEPGTAVPGITVCGMASPLDILFFNDDCVRQIL
jgi:hypothetical protein